jgi:hypothetical protein
MFTIENHAKVRVGNHTAGRVTAFVIDPHTVRLTHVAVRPHGLLPAAHLYHLSDLEASAGTLRVTGPAADAEPTCDNEVTFVPIGGWPHPQQTYDVGIVHDVGWHRTALGGSHHPHWTPGDLDMVVDFDKLPKGLVELDGASEVYDRSRHLLGHLHSVTVDETGALRALHLRRFAFWPPHAVDVPAASIKRIVNGEVWLRTSHRDASHASGSVQEGQVAS